jgi:hypothetical protein
VADSLIFQWFTYTSFVDGVRPVSKSSAERFEKYFTPEQIGELVHALNKAVSDKQTAQELLYAETELRFDRIFADTSCAQANIHFPVDWVLLRDAARTLVKSITLIRKQGLKHRIGRPEQLMRGVNKLCIEITHTRKKPDSKKVRKAVFRQLKAQVGVIERHGQRYLELLEESWKKTEWTELEKNVVVRRMRNVLDQLPQAVHQAHERIIGERRVDNKDKILSLYERDIEVLVRGKAGAEVEFGNGLYLAEQTDGLIVDWALMLSKIADSKLVRPSIERIKSNYGAIASYGTDRGFDSPDASQFLELENIINYLGRPMRSKGFAHRKTHVAWCVLAHNLWKLASMAVANKEQIEERRKAA